jgi:hypothetical protein
MKKNYVSMFLVVVLCMAMGNVQAQGIKGLLEKAKGAVSNVTNKKGGGKDDSKSVHAIAKPLVVDIKNQVSEIRSLTGLTKANFEKKVKSMGYVETTDDTGLLGGGSVYKSKSKGYSLRAKMGTRGGESLTMEVSKVVYNKTPDFSAMKVNFLNFGDQCTDLKAEFKNANVDERGKMFSGVGANNLSKRTSKFLPALDNMINAKKEFFATDEYFEQDYEYRAAFYFIKVTGGAMLEMTVVDKTVDSLEG